jgi:clorobiocin biosynthesis protein CloN7
MLIGHPVGCAGFGAVAPLLASDYTVVTYDPRGFAQSTIDDRDQDAEPNLLADEVRRVVEAVGKGPAHVFGSSGGAVTGLALVARHHGHVRTLVAHEPPLALVLPEADEVRAGFQDIYDVYRKGGAAAAWQRFSNFTGVHLQRADAAAPPSPETVAMSERFFRHGLLPIVLYEVDFSALHATPTRVVVAGGTSSEGQFPRRAADALAERLGKPLIEFPGAHVGFVAEPKEFAKVLRQTLG